MVEFERVNRPVEAAGSFYNRLAPWYDILASSEKRFLREGIKLLDPSPAEWILEIGSGTGYAQKLISTAVFRGKCFGLDLSPGMIAIAQKRLSVAGLLDHAGLFQSDTLPIPLLSDSMDGIFSSFTLELFDTPLIPEVLDECRRILKPAGRLVIVSLSKDQPLGWMGRTYEAFHDRFPKLADCRPIPVLQLLDNAGFKIIDSHQTGMWGLPVIIILATF